MRAGSASDLIIGLLMLSPAAYCSDGDQASTMRREDLARSFSVGGRGELDAAVNQLKADVAEADETVQQNDKLDREFANEEDPRQLMIARSELQIGTDNKCKSETTSNAKTCDKATNNICGWQAASGSIQGSCRSCEALNPKATTDCQNAADKGSKCRVKTDSDGKKTCKATSSSSSLQEIQTYSGASSNTQNESPALSDLTSQATADDLHEDEVSNFEDVRDLLTQRTHYDETVAGCKSLAKGSSTQHLYPDAETCNKASKSTCGWKKHGKECRSCEALTKQAECDAAKEGGSKCTWDKDKSPSCIVPSTKSSSLVQATSTNGSESAAYLTPIQDHSDLLK